MTDFLIRLQPQLLIISNTILGAPKRTFSTTVILCTASIVVILTLLGASPSSHKSDVRDAQRHHHLQGTKQSNTIVIA